MEKIELKLTQDGSHTLYSERFNQHYHSTFGALQESQRIYIELGLEYVFEVFDEISIFEMGFGTGLNTFLSLQMAAKHQRKINYTAIEAYPVEFSVAQKLNYDSDSHELIALHEANWNQKATINQYFSLEKINNTLEDFQTNKRFHLVYFDAFAPKTQPELWTTEIFIKIASMMQKGGILTTYCSKGYVRRNLKTAGFRVEKHKGPIGKFEVVRAFFEG